MEAPVAQLCVGTRVNDASKLALALLQGRTNLHIISVQCGPRLHIAMHKQIKPQLRRRRDRCKESGTKLKYYMTNNFDERTP